MRPAEVWGEVRKPRSSRSDMMLRTVAGLTDSALWACRFLDPTGCPSRMCISTSVRSRSVARPERLSDVISGAAVMHT